MRYTLSTERLLEFAARAAAMGLQERVKFELLDYRALDRRFDRIVSVGMFEHVGVGHYARFFRTLASSSTPMGRRYCTSSASPLPRAAPILGSENTSFLAATSLRSARWCLRSRGPGC